MPGLATTLLIRAVDDGLLLHRTDRRSQHMRDLQIEYGTNKISVVPRTETDDHLQNSIQAYGLVGILDLKSTSHLIAITGREQKAQIRGKAIYKIKDVTLIPLSSKAAAEKAIANAEKKLKQEKSSTAAEQTEESDLGEDIETSSVPDEDEKPPEASASGVEQSKGPLRQSTSFAKDVIRDRGRYGRFARRWFGKGGTNTNARRKQGLSNEEELSSELADHRLGATTQDGGDAGGEAQAIETEQTGSDDATAESSEPSRGKPAIESLTPRILRSARLYFSTSGFFFSYDHDLSGTLTQRDTRVSDIPLWKRFSDSYFWNRHLIDPFVKIGLDELILPLMQGFVAQRAFSIAKAKAADVDTVAGAVEKPEEVVEAHLNANSEEISDESKDTQDFLLTLISRRSIKRAGLRFLRRGVDDDGNVANSVETEQILSTTSWELSDKAFSLTQTRGSIPLHFSQTPGRLKPTPVLYGSQTTNEIAFRTHFESLSARYGRVQAVSLIDTQPPEVSIGQSYEDHAKQLNESGGIRGNEVQFEWFDFHGLCKGMKFENVSILLDSIQDTLKSFGWVVKQDDRNIGQQTGVVRTNCMDCLDRTNVVQSAIASWALEQQLAHLGLNIDLKNDPKTQWFNTLWADNGDAISKQYAGTAALKGDFTRTRKRNWTGALSDFSLTMTRYYNNMLGDYFLQTCIDYFLGNEGPTIFDEFETDMISKDCALDVRRIRQNAIDTCVQMVLDDPNEDLIAGWTLSCPRKSNTLRTLPFEECILLLTAAAVYFCRFDWDTEKVASFERVDVVDISEIWRGAYITNALGPTHLDDTKNVGFAFRYKTSGSSIIRRNTRSLQNEGEATEDSEEGKDSEKQDETPDQKLLAFKVLPPQVSAVRDDHVEMTEMNETALSKHICNKIQEATQASLKRQHGLDHLGPDQVPHVQEKDVISVAEAKRNTGYLESIGYSMKRLVW